MSKFKVGDKIAPARSPRDYFGCIEQIDGKKAVIKSKYGDEFYIDLKRLVLYDETALSDDAIYNMLKPKMKHSNVWNHGYRAVAYNDGYHLVREDNDVIKAIALAYRSGYLRAKKGRPFKIGGEKE